MGTKLETNGTKVLVTYVLKILSGIVVGLIVLGVGWLVSTTHATSFAIFKIERTVEEHTHILNSLPKGFPPKTWIDEHASEHNRVIQKVEEVRGELLENRRLFGMTNATRKQ